jgi:uncharacterized membrane protein (DUF485 family)
MSNCDQTGERYGTDTELSAGYKCSVSKSQREADIKKKEVLMFLILFMVLLVAWLLGWVGFHVAGGLIHLLLIVAVVALILHFVRGRRVWT